jgi:citrate lyase gamma subunit
MAQFFWFKYYKTKSPFFKRIALSVEQKGGVDIKARPYWQNAIDDFNSNVKERFTKQIKMAIVQQIQDMQNRTRE